MLLDHSGEAEAEVATWRRSPSEVQADGLSQGTVLTVAPFCKSSAPTANNDLQEGLLTKYLSIFNISVSSLGATLLLLVKDQKAGSCEKDPSGCV